MPEYLQVLQITCIYPSGNPRENAYVAGKLRSMKTNEHKKGLRKKCQNKTQNPEV